MKLYRLDYLDSKSFSEQELFFIKKENAISFLMDMLKKKKFSLRFQMERSKWE